MSGPYFDASEEGLSLSGLDVVIVGSGAGGSAAARTLAEAGLSVAVLEEGPFIPTSMLGFQAFESMRNLMRHQGQMTAFGPAAVPVLQACCVGGTTFVNSAIVWRLPDAVLAKWHADHGLAEGLRANDLDDAYAIIERDMSARAVTDEIANECDRKMALGAERAGIEHRPIHRYENGCKGSGRCLHGCPNEAKQSGTVNYLRRAAEAGARVFSHAKVDRVVVENGRATGVIGHIGGTGPQAGQRFRVSARKAVIVSASVVQSPNILRRSRVGTRNSALGNHFRAHPGATVVGIYPERVNTWTGAAQGYEAYGLRDTLGVKLESINVPPEVAASRLPGFGPDFSRWVEQLPYFAIWSIAVKAEGEGTVRPSRIFGGDLLRYAMTQSDLTRLRAGMKKLAEMHFLAGAKAVAPIIHGLPDTITADQLSVYDNAPLNAQCYSMVATHLFGTCRAGADPAHHVVDPHLQVHGTPGLYVMDASVFPSNTGVNPQHSVMAIATVASRRIAAA